MSHHWWVEEASALARYNLAQAASDLELKSESDTQAVERLIEMLGRASKPSEVLRLERYSEELLHQLAQ